MPTVHIPSMMQKLTDGQDTVRAAGGTVGEVIEQLDKAYPGSKSWLLEGNRLKSNISVAIDGEVSPLGLLQKVDDDSEIHFVPAISGGRIGLQPQPTQ